MPPRSRKWKKNTVPLPPLAVLAGRGLLNPCGCTHSSGKRTQHALRVPPHHTGFSPPPPSRVGQDLALLGPGYCCLRHPPSAPAPHTSMSRQAGSREPCLRARLSPKHERSLDGVGTARPAPTPSREGHAGCVAGAPRSHLPAKAALNHPPRLFIQRTGQAQPQSRSPPAAPAPLCHLPEVYLRAPGQIARLLSQSSSYSARHVPPQYYTQTVSRTHVRTLYARAARRPPAPPHPLSLPSLPCRTTYTSSAIPRGLLRILRTRGATWPPCATACAHWWPARSARRCRAAAAAPPPAAAVGGRRCPRAAGWGTCAQAGPRRPVCGAGSAGEDCGSFACGLI